MSGVILGFGIGLVVGLVYFGGLHLTVQRIVASRHPAGLAAFSLVVRVCIAALAFALVVRSGGWALMAALAGLVCVRTVAVRLWGTADSGAVHAEGRRAADT